MAQADWRRYHGVVVRHERFGSVQLWPQMFRKKDNAYYMVEQIERMTGGQFVPVGVVNVKGKTVEAQRQLCDATLRAKPWK